jgi:hypothetical protein
MIKKISNTLFATVLTVGIASAMDPNTRMEKVRDLFTQYGAETFKILNDLGVGGTGGGENGKGAQTSLRADIAQVIKSDDNNSFVFCVADGKWAVYPPEPMKIGTNAMTATDANGRPFVETMIKALRNSPGGKAHHVRYDVTTPDGRIQAREATLWKSSALLSRKNDTGKKFFCGTSVKAHP